MGSECGCDLAAGSTGHMDLTDAQWERIAPLMPTPRGNCKLTARQALNGWLFITRQGCAWRALPERYGPWFTVYMRGKRGGLTTKLHAVVRDDRLPLILALTPGQSGDAPGGRRLLEQLGPQSGRPQLVADRAYEGRPTRRCAQALGWDLVAPPHPNRPAARQRPLDRAAYRARNLVERCCNRLKRFRGIATRYHKLDAVFLHMIYLACIYIVTK